MFLASPIWALWRLCMLYALYIFYVACYSALVVQHKNKKNLLSLLQ